MNKNILTGDKCRSNLANGIKKLYEAVGSTLGPGGRTVIIEDQFGGSPIITKDGVTVARNINFKDQYENLGVEIVKQVASKTEELVGDGTTTATVLAYNIYTKCIEYVEEFPDRVNELKDSLKSASKLVIEKIDRDTVSEVTEDDVYNIAMISSNGDKEISELITKAFTSVTKDGSINVDISQSVDTELKLSSGMEFNCGYCSPNFITDMSTSSCKLIDCIVFISSSPIVYKEDILPVMHYAKEHGRSLLVISTKVVGEALATLVTNKLQGTLQSCAVNIPQLNVTETLSDMAIITGAKIVHNSVSKLENFDELLGKVNSASITSKSLKILDSCVDKQIILDYITSLKENILPNLKKYEIPGFELRLAKLGSGVATLLVGGRTDSDLKERKDRVDDAVLAVRSACDGGTVIGGGRELYQISEELIGDNIGEKILRDSLKSPYKLIMKNAYLNVRDYSFNKDEGIDIRSKVTGNLRKLGILDPAKVTKSAFMNSMAIVDLLLSTNVVITNDEVKKTPLTDKMYDL